jgi:hypothetical protein
LAVSGSTIYAGGDFNGIGGQARNHIAALDASTGNATAWNPDAINGEWDAEVVRVITISGSTVYVSGEFTGIGGQTRNGLAALDASTGNATPWNPNADGRVSALAVSGSTVYVGGGFSSIGGQPRNDIAALDASTGNATAWNPNVSGSIDALVVSGSTVYAGGYFTSIGGLTRNHMAALDASTGRATPWNPNPGPIMGIAHGWSSISALAVSGSKVYVGGDFARIGWQMRFGFAQFDVKWASSAGGHWQLFE